MTQKTRAVLCLLALAASTGVADTLSETEKHQLEKALRDTKARMAWLRGCMAGYRECSAARASGYMLHLTPDEMQSMFGPPHYRLHLGGYDLYYWIIPVTENGVRKNVRFQVTYGECYKREKSSRKNAVCEIRTVPNPAERAGG